MKNIYSSIIASYKTLFIIIFLVLSVNAKGQSIQTEFISIAEGLSSATVRPITQDSYGLIWLGTDNGLHHYDGYKFVRFKNVPGKANSLQNDVIWGLALDAEQNIWAANDQGISKYDRKKNEFINYDLGAQFNIQGNAGGRVFNILIDSKNRMWAASGLVEVLLFDSLTNRWSQVEYLANDTIRTKIQSGLVLALGEDKNKNIWVGSRGHGLMRYRENDSIFVPAKFSKSSVKIDFTIDENYITYLYFDPTNTMWITTRNGIYKYNSESGDLRIIKEYDYAKLIVGNNWNSVNQDNQGNVWITNNYRGLLKFDGISDEYEELSIAGRSRNRDGSSDINTTRAAFDNTGILWIGTTTQGIMKYDSSNEPFLHYTYEEGNTNGLNTSGIFGLLESKVHLGRIFVGTRGGGLNIFDQTKRTFSQENFKVINDQFGGSVRGIAEDDDGSLWLGTWGDGIIKMNPNYREVNRYTNDSTSFNSLSDDRVRIIKKDREGYYWIGTNQGLNLLNPRTNKIKRIGSLMSRVYPQELYDLASKLVKTKKLKASIDEVADYQDLTKEFEVLKPRKYLVVSAGEGFADDTRMYDFGWIENSKNDTIWGHTQLFESYHCGGAMKNRLYLEFVDLKPGKYKLRYKSDDSHGFNKWNEVPPAYPEFWGIKIIEMEDANQITEISDYLNQNDNKLMINGNNIRSIHISKNIIWVGDDVDGLNKIDREKNKVTVYSYDEKSSNTLSNNSVQYIHEDKDGILWLATNGGLNKFDPEKETFTIYTEEDGLPTNYIASILPGNEGELWIATRSGISKMVTDKETKQVTFVNYDTEDGLGGMDFVALVAIKTRNGEYFFGGEHGLNAFTPKGSNNAEPSLIFSDLKISNKLVKSFHSDDSPLETSLFELKNLDLMHNQNDLTFTFAALHYADPSKNHYAHKLIGYDEDWIFDNKREATYTNLDPGEYTFAIKGSNRDGVWSSNSKTIDIKINPPWWLTVWAYIFYGFILLGFVFVIDRIQRRRLLVKARERLKIQNAEHRAEAAELQAKAVESERRALEVEFEHKKKELNEARELQLSMLPKELPQLPHLDIAVYMRTATEVGGDYYDFHISMDGTLTVVLGDATGHGMKAGTMVTTTKSLFNVLAPNPNIVETFHEMTRCLKLMHLEKLSMCMTMLKIMGNKIQMSAAGMPPVFIYKRESQSIEEHLMKGMPLGTFSDFPYSKVESDLSSGDTILIMSDGFPELFNDEKEMYGYKRARNYFEEIAGESPEEIITKLKNAGSEWTNDKDPDDDVTFVVIKVK
jgi:serine phosphatase RsbU (regulator of sigma subunit)/ligand-binding sensor domain-containing protein